MDLAMANLLFITHQTLLPKRFFSFKMVEGVVDQSLQNNLGRVRGRLKCDLIGQLIEYLNQLAMLCVNDWQTGVEVFVPGEDFDRGRGGRHIRNRSLNSLRPRCPLRAGTREWYDLRADPGEEVVLAASSPLAGLLDAAAKAYLKDALRLRPHLPHAQDREALRELGYIQ